MFFFLSCARKFHLQASFMQILKIASQLHLSRIFYSNSWHQLTTLLPTCFSISLHFIRDFIEVFIGSLCWFEPHWHRLTAVLAWTVSRGLRSGEASPGIAVSTPPFNTVVSKDSKDSKDWKVSFFRWKARQISKTIDKWNSKLSKLKGKDFCTWNAPSATGYPGIIGNKPGCCGLRCGGWTWTTSKTKGRAAPESKASKALVCLLCFFHPFRYEKLWDLNDHPGWDS